NGQKVTTEKGIEYVFEAPPMPANRILFIAHGCGHSALDFWPKSPQCLNCVGLPEERRIVTKALTRGYFVVAVSSAGQDHGGCWDVKVDAKKVMRVLSLIKKKHSNLRTAPIFALGASSGGHMVAALGSRLHDIGGLCIQIMAPDISFQMNQQLFPPSQWIYMQKDSRTQQDVADTVSALRRSGAVVDSVLAKQLAITESFFSDRIEEVTVDISRAIYQALKENSAFTDLGYLRADPRHSNWRSWLADIKDDLKPDGLIADKSPIAEVLNVAYALHEITSEHMDSTLNFFEKA
ncbi:unnamed protein product, partial [Ectocarpus fasciculatus]